MKGSASSGRRSLSVAGYVALVVAYLLIHLAATIFTWRAGAGLWTYTDESDVWTRLVLPNAISLVPVVVIVAVLGWWRPVLVDDRPVRRWVWIVPGLMAMTVLVGTNYPGLAEQSGGLVFGLLMGALLIGVSEEAMFRGVGVTAFRANGYSERAVALWTSILFGLSHAVSLVGGPAGLIQVAYTLVGGYLYYLTRRVSGGLLAPVLLHGLWDLGVFSAGVVEGETYALVPVFFLPHLVLLPILLLRRGRIEPVGVASA